MPISQWSGGTTTQLMIYPEGSDYAKRDFLFRISSAKVELEESNFTHLPGVHRRLMILEGALEVQHQEHHAIRLQKFDIDEFEGDWQTHAKGKVTDFNLMTKAPAQGKLEAKILTQNERWQPGAENYRTIGLYILSGRIRASTAQFATALSQGDFVLIEDGDLLVCIAELASEIVVVKLAY